MLMVQTPAKSLTLAEFLKSPETQPASEYINGQIIQKPMPQGKHSKLQKELLFKLESVLKTQRVAEAFPELRCTFGGCSIVPDITVFLDDRIPRDPNGEIANAFPIAPDWTIEVLSPDQNQTKVINNILHCLNHGTQLGWLLDPDVQMVIVYPAESRPRSFAQANDYLPAPEWASQLQLTVGEIFGWLLG
jgi:Uma2 family endonuclease